MFKYVLDKQKQSFKNTFYIYIYCIYYIYIYPKKNINKLPTEIALRRRICNSDVKFGI